MYRPMVDQYKWPSDDLSEVMILCSYLLYRDEGVETNYGSNCKLPYRHNSPSAKSFTDDLLVRRIFWIRIFTDVWREEFLDMCSCVKVWPSSRWKGSFCFYEKINHRSCYIRNFVPGLVLYQHRVDLFLLPCRWPYLLLSLPFRTCLVNFWKKTPYLLLYIVEWSVCKNE